MPEQLLPSPEKSDLLQRIRDFELDDPSANLMFSDRLARENGWRKEFALRVIEEYKRFMFLLCIVEHPLTPSDAVDQAWHLHLVYTRSYWTEFCGRVLEREIHHGPTLGGRSERVKFTDWYNKTKEAYQEHLGCEPPDDIWPDSTVRFAAARFQRVDLSRSVVIGIPFLRRS